MKNIKILGYIPDPLDGTSWYRGAGPFNHLVRNADRFGAQFEFTTFDKYHWANMSQHHVFFAQRPFRKDHVQLLLKAKMLKMPVIVDYDDDLFCVPSDNPTFEIYSRQDIQNNITECLNIADAVFVSTETMREKFKKKTDAPITVINNAIDTDMLDGPPCEVKKQNDLVMWRGSRTHMMDMLSVANQILEIHDANPDLIFEFVGDRQPLLTSQMKADQCIYTAWIPDVPSMFHHFKARSPKVIFVPLIFNEFNKAKSNIAWLEATTANAICVAPKMPEWEMPGVFTYTNQDTFKSAVMEALSLDEFQHHNRVQTSWKHIQRHYTLNRENVLRATIIKKLAGLENISYEQSIAVHR